MVMTITKIHYKSVKLSNGETIAYQEREGGEKNVLLIHGNMTSSVHWDLVLDNMNPDYKLYALDLRGLGRSSYQQKITSIKDFSDDVKAFIEKIELTDFSVIGWSTGGAIAMHLVAEYPGCCEKLILLESCSTRGYPFYGINYERLTTYEEIKQDVSKTIPVQTAYDTKDREFLINLWNAVIYNVNRPNPDLYEKYVDDMLTQRNLAEVYHALNTFNISAQHNGLIQGNGLVKNIKLPVLVLRGDQDLIITEQMAEEIIEDIGANAKLIKLKNCGHSPLIDDLGGLLNVVTAFLDS